MKRAILAAACVAASMSLAGCGSLSALAQPGGVGEKVLQNLDGCYREYSGALGAGVTGSFRIVCDPAPKEAPSTPPAAPPGGT